MKDDTAGDPLSGIKWTRKTTEKISHQPFEAGRGVRRPGLDDDEVIGEREVVRLVPGGPSQRKTRRLDALPKASEGHQLVFDSTLEAVDIDRPVEGEDDSAYR